MTIDTNSEFYIFLDKYFKTNKTKELSGQAKQEAVRLYRLLRPTSTLVHVVCACKNFASKLRGIIMSPEKTSKTFVTKRKYEDNERPQKTIKISNAINNLIHNPINHPINYPAYAKKTKR